MKSMRMQFKAESINEQGIITGHASVFGVVDSENDIVEPGAFAETITNGTAKNGVKILAQHNEKKEPIGKTLELKEDEIGLFMRGQISDTALGRDYRQLVKDGVLDQMSIGYIAIEYDIDDQGIRHLRVIELLEISIVNYPANIEAKIESYKGGVQPVEKGNKETNKEVKQEGAGVTMTQEELTALLEQAAESGATKALAAVAPEGEKECDPSDDEPKNTSGDGQQTEPAEGQKSNKPVSEQKAAPAAGMQRKYASIYMNTGAQKKEEKSGLPAGIGWVRFQKCMMRANKDYDMAGSIARKEYDDSFLESQIKAASMMSHSQ